MQWLTLSWKSSCCGRRSPQFPCHVPSWGSRSPLVHSKILKFPFQGAWVLKPSNSSCSGCRFQNLSFRGHGSQNPEIPLPEGSRSQNPKILLAESANPKVPKFQVPWGTDPKSPTYTSKSQNCTCGGSRSKNQNSGCRGCGSRPSVPWMWFPGGCRLETWR